MKINRVPKYDSLTHKIDLPIDLIYRSLLFVRATHQRAAGLGSVVAELISPDAELAHRSVLGEHGAQRLQNETHLALAIWERTFKRFTVGWPFEPRLQYHLPSIHRSSPQKVQNSNHTTMSLCVAREGFTLCLLLHNMMPRPKRRIMRPAALPTCNLQLQVELP